VILAIYLYFPCNRCTINAVDDDDDETYQHRFCDSAKSACSYAWQKRVAKSDMIKKLFVATSLFSLAYVRQITLRVSRGIAVEMHRAVFTTCERVMTRCVLWRVALLSHLNDLRAHDFTQFRRHLKTFHSTTPCFRKKGAKLSFALCVSNIYRFWWNW